MDLMRHYETSMINLGFPEKIPVSVGINSKRLKLQNKFMKINGLRNGFIDNLAMAVGVEQAKWISSYLAIVASPTLENIFNDFFKRKFWRT